MYKISRENQGYKVTGLFPSKLANRRKRLLWRICGTVMEKVDFTYPHILTIAGTTTGWNTTQTVAITLVGSRATAMIEGSRELCRVVLVITV